METYSLEWAERLAQKLVARGARPLFHLSTCPPTVGPSAHIVSQKAEAIVQLALVPIDIWAQAVGLDIEKAPHFWYLCINGPLSDLHNAVCSALDITPNEALDIIARMRADGRAIRFEVEVLADEPGADTCIETVAALTAMLAASLPTGDHGDYYWFWENVGPEKRRALIREWARSWTQARYYEIPSE